MARYKLFVLQTADSDIEAIALYIATRLHLPVAAHKILDSFEYVFSLLTQMPYQFPLVNDEKLSARNLRKAPVKNYLIFYTVNEITKIVYVERVLYARQDWGRRL